MATVRNMLIYGAIIMTAGGALAATYILGLDYRVALLFGTLIVVTGPTVIQPIIPIRAPQAFGGRHFKVGRDYHRPYWSTSCGIDL